jgi:chaperonin cofactor prefoldin
MPAKKKTSKKKSTTAKATTTAEVKTPLNERQEFLKARGEFARKQAEEFNKRFRR